MEIPSSHAGVVKELKVKVGDTVNEGSVILSLEAAGAAAAAPAAAAPAPAAAAAPVATPTTAAPAPAGRQLRRRCRPRVRPARARRRPGRLFGRLPRRRPRHEDRARRALPDARRRVPERRLHPVQGAAARGRGDGRGQALRGARRELRARRRSTWPSSRRTRKRSIGKLTGGLAAMAKMRKVTVVQGTGEFARPVPPERRACQGRHADASSSSRPSSPPAPRR